MQSFSPPAPDEPEKHFSARGRALIVQLLALAALIPALVVGSTASSSPVAAGGPSSTCAAGYYCLSRWAITPGSTGTTMSEGWRQYTPNTSAYYDTADGYANYLGCPNMYGQNDTFSSTGSCVGYNVRSARNRDTITGRTLYIVKFTAGVGWLAVNTIPYSYVGWKAVTPSTAEAIRG